MDFLSRDILFIPGQTLVSRKPLRVFQGGQLTQKLGFHMTPELFNYGVTQQLKAGHSFHPIFKDYIKYRETQLPHRAGKPHTEDYAALYNLNANKAYDSPGVCEMYDQFIPWLGSTDFQFEWTPYYTRSYSQARVWLPPRVWRDHGQASPTCKTRWPREKNAIKHNKQPTQTTNNKFKQ